MVDSLLVRLLMVVTCVRCILVSVVTCSYLLDCVGLVGIMFLVDLVVLVIHGVNRSHGTNWFYQ